MSNNWCFLGAAALGFLAYMAIRHDMPFLAGWITLLAGDMFYHAVGLVNHTHIGQ